jgi:hypothetical protein
MMRVSSTHLQNECRIIFANHEKKITTLESSKRGVSDHALFQQNDIMHRNIDGSVDASHAAAAFLEFSEQQSDFGWCGYRACQMGRNRFRIIPKPGLSADRSDAARM